MIRNIARRGAIFAASLLLAGAAQAQLFRAYVASTGSDANPCTLSAPCRLLPAALAAVADGGEVWMLDSANFNTSTVNVTKSVAMLAVPGEVGSIVATGGGNAINIATAGIIVALRNVVVANNVTSPGNFGVNLAAASTLSIEDSLLANLPNNALVVQANGAKAYVKGTLFRNNNGYAISASLSSTVNVMESRMIGNSLGGVSAFAGGSAVVEANITDSTIAGSGVGNGATADSVSSTASARVTLTRVTIADMANGIDSLGSNQGIALVTVANSTVTGCTGNGILVAGGVIKSLGNNYIGDNATDTGSLTSTPLR
jgi:hypothetical protein